MKIVTRPAWAKILAVALCFPGLTGILYAAGVPQSAETTASHDSTDVVMLLAYVFLALVFSFLCSIAEAVLLSITPSFVARLEETHPRRAELLQKLKQDNVDRSLAAILTLNTIAHTVGAIGSGAKATVVFGSAWFGVFSAVMTLLILFLSEIVPKTLGALYWRALSWPAALFIRSLIVIMYPLIVVSEALTKLIARGRTGHSFDREEFVAMARMGGQSGYLKEEESRIISNLFLLESLTVRDIMTPRTVISAIQRDTSVSEAIDEHAQDSFSRLPLYGKDLDDVIGFALKSDLLLAKAENHGHRPVSDFRRDLMTVPSKLSISGFLEKLLDSQEHIALVFDEFGGTEGVVTLEDALETLVGTEIVDEADKTKDMQELARERWARRAGALGANTEDPPRKD